uniref:Putative secreted protein n=1 Tax=Rhipicephalus microplus TaxID=6941 RepID=A0A6M2DBU7_RHIMP
MFCFFFFFFSKVALSGSNENNNFYNRVSQTNNIYTHVYACDMYSRVKIYICIYTRELCERNSSSSCLCI